MSRQDWRVLKLAISTYTFSLHVFFYYAIPSIEEYEFVDQNDLMLRLY